MTDEELRLALRKHGQARSRARAKASIESDNIRDLIPKALEAGLTKSEIARLAMITRPALDTMLREKQEDEAEEARLESYVIERTRDL